MKATATAHTFSSPDIHMLARPADCGIDRFLLRLLSLFVAVFAARRLPFREPENASVCPSAPTPRSAGASGGIITIVLRPEKKGREIVWHATAEQRDWFEIPRVITRDFAQCNYGETDTFHISDAYTFLRDSLSVVYAVRFALQPIGFAQFLWLRCRICGMRPEPQAFSSDLIGIYINPSFNEVHCVSRFQLHTTNCRTIETSMRKAARTLRQKRQQNRKRKKSHKWLTEPQSSQILSAFSFELDWIVLSLAYTSAR